MQGSHFSRPHVMEWGQDPVLVDFPLPYTLLVSTSPQRFIMKNVQHTAKSKDFYSEQSFGHHLNPASNIYYICQVTYPFTSLSIHQFVFIFDTFQRKLEASVSPKHFSLLVINKNSKRI